MTEDIEVLKLGKMSWQKNIDNIGKESYERYCMDMRDDKDSDERDQMYRNYEETVNHDI